jgi:hypothetical protein
VATSDLLIKLKTPAVRSEVWVDVLIGQAQFGQYCRR